MRTPRRTATVVLAILAAALAVVGSPEGVAAQAPPASGPTSTEAPAEPPSLPQSLETVLSGLPDQTCLTVTVDGRPLHRHEGNRPLVPASNLKVLTAAIALDVLGEDHRFRTTVRSAVAPVDGVVVGDLYLVGGGDPLLTTDLERFVRGVGDDRHPTSLDALADRVAAAGVRQVTGAVVGDESRFDGARTVGSWPDRYVEQDQSGPLSALSVDDAHRYELRPDEEPRRLRADRPALTAAATFTGMLQARGIQVGAFPGEGVAPGGAAEVAAVESAPLSAVVAELLTFSDNETGELLLKEIGRTAGAGGSTEAGAAVVRERSAALGLAGPGDVIVDGSGLDPGNRLSCDSIAAILDAAGPDGTLADGLAVAGRTGTLRGRLRTSALEGRLRGKTGSLREVTSLAGFVPLASGETATFAMITNGEPDANRVWNAQTFVAELLASHHTECRQPVEAPLVLPGGLYAGSMGTLAMFPLQTVVLPGSVLPLQVFEDRYRTLVDRCVAEDEDFGTVLISRGREVGGGDERTDVGSRIRILRAERDPSGVIRLLGGAVGRLKVERWLPDDPHPVAEVQDWPDPEATPADHARVEDLTRRLRTVLALHNELGDPVAPATVPVDGSDPSAASWALAQHAPVTAYDRQRLLAAPDVPDRLTLLDELLGDAQLVAEARLGSL